MTIGTSSLGAIETELHSAGHSTWNHKLALVAPQPQEPDISDVMCVVAANGDMTLFPFQA